MKVREIASQIKLMLQLYMAGNFVDGDEDDTPPFKAPRYRYYLVVITLSWQMHTAIRMEWFILFQSHLQQEDIGIKQCWSRTIMEFIEELANVSSW